MCEEHLPDGCSPQRAVPFKLGCTTLTLVHQNGGQALFLLEGFEVKII